MTCNPLLGIYLEKNMIWKDTCFPMFIAALFKIAKTWNQPKCPSTEEWIKKNLNLLERNNPNKLIKHKQTQRIQEQAYSYQGEGWGDRIVREFGMNVYALLYLKWVANKDLLCSTWNSAQCYKAAWMRGVWGRMDTCICMAESLCYSPETVTTFNQLYPIQNNERIHDYCWIPLFCLPHLSWWISCITCWITLCYS